KKFTFYLKDLPIFYIISYILAISIILNRLFFCDVSYITRGGNIIKEKAFLYAKYRDIFIRLGLITRFKEALKLY
ncbi:uncharacterized protein K441DRAFT_571523, partial [Cenococcum geophilum 1.58]|uniref:uncharacterized protein n=1 Tax=Cenococcum geophilum 1.58 TaxID=794803 RepID=UPI00358FC824